MTLEVDARPGVAAGAQQINTALSELAREAARSVVQVRGSYGSSGSGVIWDQPGLVITNHHVVPGQAAQVCLTGGQWLEARVVRRAAALDLVALRVAEGQLPLGATVGESDRLRVGDLVVAVGNPMGERNAPSVGILASAADSVLRLSITLRPGNSGGALVNARGEVVGIPHMVTGSRLAMAVSASTVRRFLTGANGETQTEAEVEVEHDQLRWV